MSAPSLLTRPVRRYLLGRLERLHGALSGLAQRLRESLAAVVGEHVGDDVREAVHAVLERRPPDARPQLPDYHEPPRYETRSREPPYLEPPHREPQSEFPEYEDPNDRDRDSGGLWHDPTPVTVPPSPGPDPAQPNWWTLLPSALQALGWWLRRKETCRPVLAVLGIGVVASLVALVAGPVAGALAATAGTALALTRMADGFSHSVGGLAGVPPGRP